MWRCNIVIKKRPKFIDISRYEKILDWNKVKDEFSFVVMKATEGDWWTDPTLDEVIIGANSVNLKVVLFHYFDPFRDCLKQAEYFWSVVKNYASVCRFCMDWESENAARRNSIPEWVNRCMTRFQELSGVKDEHFILYSGPWFTRRFKQADLKQLAKYPYWFASYLFNDKQKGIGYFDQNYASYVERLQTMNYEDTQAYKTYTLSPFTKLFGWQWTDWTKRDYIIGRVDENVFLGSQSDLDKFFGVIVDTEPIPEPVSDDWKKPVDTFLREKGYAGPEIK